MSITDEGGGRLNAFAKEPDIELVSEKAGYSKGSRLFILVGALFVGALIAFSLTIK